MRFTEENLKDLKRLFNSSIEELMKSEAFMDRLVNVVKDHFISELESLKSENEQLKRDNVSLAEKLDDLEQYTRRNSVRVLGIPENKNVNVENEVLSLFNSTLGLSVTVENIDRCHRVGAFNKSRKKPRPIIVKFVSYRTRAMVCASRRKLKGSNIVIQEDLTTRRFNLLKEVQSVVKRGKAWSRDGRIMVEHVGSIVRVKNSEDITSLGIKNNNDLSLA